MVHGVLCDILQLVACQMLGFLVAMAVSSCSLHPMKNELGLEVFLISSM